MDLFNGGLEAIYDTIYGYAYSCSTFGGDDRWRYRMCFE